MSVRELRRQGREREAKRGEEEEKEKEVKGGGRAGGAKSGTQLTNMGKNTR